MRTEDVQVPPAADLSDAEALIESCFPPTGLHVSLKGTVAAHKGSIHWHLKCGKEAGTLEVTLWPARRRLWLSVHANRHADWIEEAVVRLKAAMEDALLR